MSRRTALGFMVLCLLSAAAMRLPDLITVPPGLHYDEAANGILAAEIGLQGERPVFITSYTGKEVLFFYLAGGLMRLAGASVYTLRLTAAFIGVLTVAVTYWLGLELLGDRRLALIAAALLAVSFWHLLFSRLGFRAISQPLLQAVTVAALFRGLRRSAWPWLMLAGVALGLTAYTYLAARIFPIVLAFSLLPFIWPIQNWRENWRKLVIFASAGLVVALPLLLFFIANPDSFWVRIDQVLPAGRELQQVGSSYLKSLGMIFLTGDPYWRFNIPGRPLMNWFWGALLVAGWLLLLIDLRRLQPAWSRSAHLLLLLIPPVMILPTALALGEIVPSNLRAIGLLPFFYFLPAYALMALAKFLQEVLWKRMSGHRSAGPDGAGEREGFDLEVVDFNFTRKLSGQRSTTVIFTLIVSFILFWSGVSTARAYFVEWSSRNDLFYDSDADLVEVARYLDQLPSNGETIYVAALHQQHPTLAFLSRRYEQIKWLTESQALVFPAAGAARYIFPKTSPRPEWASSLLPATPVAEGPEGTDGEATFEVYRLGQAPSINPQFTLNANFADQITLLGYDIGIDTDPINQDRKLPLILYWRVERPPDRDLSPFVHLEDPWRFRWSQAEPSVYPPGQWSAGETVVQRVEVPLPDGLPPGDYLLKVGFFDRENQEQLARLDDAGRYAGNAYPIDQVKISAVSQPTTLPTPPETLDLQVARGLTLLGYERPAASVSAGGALPLALYWHAETPQEAMLLRFELVPPRNHGRILADTIPVHGTYAFDRWPTPIVVVDRQLVRVPDTVPAGDYKLRLRILGEGGDSLATADLGSVLVEEANRLFDPPVMRYPLAADFGNEILLTGYNLEQLTAENYRLDLAWQAITDPGEDYTVFVHVLDREGVCCIWQQDNVPRQGTYPTRSWLAGEVVLESYEIQLPTDLAPGQYPVEVGLYLPDTGRRLLVTMPGIKDNDALHLWPIEVE